MNHEEIELIDEHGRDISLSDDEIDLEECLEIAEMMIGGCDD